MEPDNMFSSENLFNSKEKQIKSNLIIMNQRNRDKEIHVTHYSLIQMLI